MLYTPGHDSGRPAFLSNGRYSFPPHHMTDADRLYFSRQDTPRYEYIFGKPVGFLQNRISGIRTHGLCVPNAALYQTEPQSDMPSYLTTNDIIVQRMCTNIFLGKYTCLFKIFLTLFCQLYFRKQNSSVYLCFFAPSSVSINGVNTQVKSLIPQSSCLGTYTRIAGHPM